MANFKRWIIDGHYTSGGGIETELPNPAPKPIILTEWGAPASIRTRDGQPPPPPNPQWVSASPPVADEFHGAPGYRAARLIQQIASDIYGPRSTLSTTGGGILSGGYVFEFQDEWWKEAELPARHVVVARYDYREKQVSVRRARQRLLILLGRRMVRADVGLDRRGPPS